MDRDPYDSTLPQDQNAAQEGIRIDPGLIVVSLDYKAHHGLQVSPTTVHFVKYEMSTGQSIFEVVTKVK